MPNKKPPAPQASNIIFGNLGQASEDSVAFYDMMVRDFQDIARYRYFMKEFYWINNPDYIRTIMTDPKFGRSYSVHKIMKSFLGHSLFSQEGMEHRHARSLMLPAFHKKRLAQLAEMFVAKTQKKVATWQDNAQLDMSEEMMALTLEIVAEALFGSSVDTNSAVLKEGFEVIQSSIDVIYPYYAALLPNWFPVIQNGETRDAISLFQETTRAIIEKRRESGEDTGDLLSMLLLAQDEDGQSLSDDEVIGQVAALLFAGHETTANALSWAWYALTRNPRVLEKALNEIDTVLGGRTVTLEDLPNLPYVRMVIDETLRLYPPAWYTERSSSEDITLGEYTVPVGSPVVITVLATHRDERNFDNPLEFRPERFSEENKAKMHKFAYLPFGSGVHKCIGDNFALMEMHLVITTMLQHVTVDIDEDFEPTPNPVVTMGLEEGLPVTLSKRKVAVTS